MGRFRRDFGGGKQQFVDQKENWRKKTFFFVKNKENTRMNQQQDFPWLFVVALLADGEESQPQFNDDVKQRNHNFLDKLKNLIEDQLNPVKYDLDLIFNCGVYYSFY